jgi:hypothetical protein
MELRVIQAIEIAADGDRVEAKLFTVRIHHANQLHMKRIKMQLIIASVTRNQGDRGRATRLDFPDLRFQLTSFRTKTGKQLMITSGARSNDPPQVFNLLGLKHGSDSEPAIDVDFIYRRITTELN